MINQQVNRTILQNRIDNAMLRRKPGAKEAVMDLVKQGSMITDYPVPMKELNFGIDASEETAPIIMSFSDVQQGVGVVSSLHQNAIGQFAEKVGMPQSWSKKMAQEKEPWKRKLIAENFTRHAERSDDSRVLVRCVGDQARAVLSERYRRMNMAPIFIRFAKACEEQGGQLWGGVCGELRAYLEIVIPHIEVIETPNNGTVYQCFGAQISSSDFGQGSLDIRAFTVQAVCENGMIGQTLLRKVHLGKRLDEDINYSRETYELDTRTMASMASDIAKEVLSPEYIERQKKAIIGASEQVVEVKPMMEKLPKVGLTKDEVDMVNDFMMESDPESGVQGKPTVWKFKQAITAMAREAQPVRMRELQEIAGTKL